MPETEADLRVEIRSRRPTAEASGFINQGKCWSSPILSLWPSRLTKVPLEGRCLASNAVADGADIQHSCNKCKCSRPVPRNKTPKRSPTATSMSKSVKRSIPRNDRSCRSPKTCCAPFHPTNEPATSIATQSRGTSIPRISVCSSSSTLRPSISASAVSETRCRSVGRAISTTSSGTA